MLYEPIGYAIYADANDGVGGSIYRNNIIVTANPSTWIAQILAADRFDSDYNIYFCSGGSTRFSYLGVTYTTLAAFAAATGQEAHSLYIAPSFVSATPVAAADFRLAENSPGVNAGVNITATVGAYSDYLGISIPQDTGADIGAYESTEIPPDPPGGISIRSVHIDQLRGNP